ncbi:MAG TPA: energy-coupling factor transporter transmembrane component T [Candidatus Eisenbacteria bacterium]|jgi:energy-coupling factor transporter transmembrane protein EcfT
MNAPLARGEVLAPLLLGALVGSLVAGRLETGALCVLAAAIAGAAAGAGRPSRTWARVLVTGCSLALALNLYLVPGRALPLPSIAGARATAEGLALGILLALRITGAAVALHGLSALWPGERAADEIAARLAPLERLRVPVRRARATLALALRFAPLTAEEFRRVARMQALRAGRPPRGPRAWLVRQRAAIVPAMVSSLERAERVALALEARHYRLRPIAPVRRSALGEGAGAALAAVALLWRA